MRTSPPSGEIHCPFSYTSEIRERNNWWYKTSITIDPYNNRSSSSQGPLKLKVCKSYRITPKTVSLTLPCVIAFGAWNANLILTWVLCPLWLVFLCTVIPVNFNILWRHQNGLPAVNLSGALISYKLSIICRGQSRMRGSLLPNLWLLPVIILSAETTIRCCQSWLHRLEC